MFAQALGIGVDGEDVEPLLAGRPAQEFGNGRRCVGQAVAGEGVDLHGLRTGRHAGDGGLLLVGWFSNAPRSHSPEIFRT